MKLKSILLVGLGAGGYYLFGTPEGKVQFGKLKARGQEFLGRSDVQDKVADLTDQAKGAAGGLPDPLQDAATSAADKVQDGVNEGNTSF